MKTSDLLKKAKEVVKNPHHWVQDDYAVNAKGDRVDVGNETACRFCMMGAFRKAVFGTDTETRSSAAFNSGGGNPASHLTSVEIRAARSAWEFVEKQFVKPKGFNSIVSFNDARETSHEDVIGVFDAAIEKAIENELEDEYNRTLTV